MRWLAVTALTMVILVSTGCGSDVTVVASTGNSTIVVTTNSAPTLVLAQFRQDTANRSVLGSVIYSTSGSDIGTMTISVTDSRGVEVSQSVDDLAAFSGLTSGTIQFSIDYARFQQDTYTVTIFVSNRAGNRSNPVYRSFPVP